MPMPRKIDGSSIKTHSLITMDCNGGLYWLFMTWSWSSASQIFNKLYLVSAQCEFMYMIAFKCWRLLKFSYQNLVWKENFTIYQI